MLPHSWHLDNFVRILRPSQPNLRFNKDPLLNTEYWSGASSDCTQQATHTAQQIEVALQHFLRSYSLSMFGCGLADISKPSLLTRTWIAQDPYTHRINALILMERVGYEGESIKGYAQYVEALRGSTWTPHWRTLSDANSLLQTDDGAGLILRTQT
jgi:hypothetical protein